MGTAETLKAVATGQMTAREARTPYDVLAQQLEARLDEFAKILGSRGNAEAYIRVVKNAVLATPDLLNADRQSLLLAAMRAAQDGLMPDGREAVLNIYNTRVKVQGNWTWIKKAQYLPMVGGLVKLLYASGEITYIDAAVWYERDVFHFTRGDNVCIVHEPYLGDEDPGKILGAYVVVKLKSGEIKREVMPRRDIEKVRAASKAVDEDGKPTGPWKDWYDQQAIKSVIKRVNKQLPKVDRLERAIAHDNEEMHTAIAGQASMGDISTTPSAPEGAGVPALEHNPSEVLEPLIGGEQREVVGAGQDTGSEQQHASAQQQAQPESTSRAKKGSARDTLHSTLLVRMREAKTPADGDAILQDGLALPQEQYAELERMFHERFPKAG